MDPRRRSMSAHNSTSVAQSPAVISGRHSIPIVVSVPCLLPACHAALLSSTICVTRPSETTWCAELPRLPVYPRSHATTFACFCPVDPQWWIVIPLTVEPWPYRDRLEQFLPSALTNL